MQSGDKSLRKKKRRKILFISLVISIFLFATAWLMLDRWSKKYGFSGAGDFVKTVIVNYWSSFDAEYESAEITISEEDYLKLVEQREEHLNRGIITKTEDRYVKAIITYQGKKIKCKLRLKGHMTDHLQDQKWSFRVKTAGGDALMGMKIFTLQHPGTRNYIYEWIYHQLLEQEGIASVRYSFLNLKVNGESWGIYALEENFASELIDHRKLPKGPILGFNPDLYWYARLNHFEKKEVDLSDMDGLSTSPEAYDEEENFNDKESRSDYLEAFLKLEKFKRGELTTSEVFDIDKLARFHAIIDLVGGHFSLDWSDVKYYYNPITQKIEPIGYESFSVHNITQLAGSFKFRNRNEAGATLHERIFSDPEFFRRYVLHLKRISEKKYLDAFFKEKDDRLKNNLAILYCEFPYKKLPLTPYYKNQDNIKALLKTPITTMVYLEDVGKDTLFLTAGNSSALPVMISSVEINGKKITLEESLFFSSRRKNEHVFFESIAIRINDTLSNKDLQDIRINVHYPGIEKNFELKVKPIEVDEKLSYKDHINAKPNHQKFSFVEVDEEKREIVFDSGDFTIEENLIFPEGYKIIINEGFRLSLEKGSSIISGSPMIAKGSEEFPVTFCSDDSTGRGIVFLNCKSKSVFKNTNFINLNLNVKKNDTYKAMITTYGSSMEFKSCVFSSEAEKAISFYKSQLIIQNSQFFNFKDKAVDIHFGKLKCQRLEFSNCETAIDINGSDGTLEGISIKKSVTAIKLDNESSIKGKNWKINDSEVGVHVTDNSKLDLEEAEFKKMNVGFRAEKKSDVFGPSRIEVSGLKKSDVKSISEKDKNSVIKIK